MARNSPEALTGRRDRQKDGSANVEGNELMADRTLVTDPPTFSRLETFTAVAVVGLLALALGLVALVRPVQTVERRSIPYVHSGSFSYAAEPRVGSPYGPKGLKVGDPVLIDQVGPVAASFDYHLKNKGSADIHGSASLVAVVSLPQGLSREFDIAEQRSFSGRDVTVSGRLPLAAIERHLETALSSLDGPGFGAATLTLVPVIEVRGALAGHDLKAKFSPELEFVLEGSVLRLAETGSTGVGERGSDLETIERGKVAFERTVANTVPLMVAEPTVPVARGIGFGVAGLCLLAGLWVARPLWRSGEGATENARIRTLYNAHIVEVTDLSLRGGPVARVGSIDALVDLAKKYESKIMHVTGLEGDSYSVWDNGLLYEYRPRGGEEMDEIPGKHSDLPTLNGSVPVANGSQKSPHKAKN